MVDFFRFLIDTNLVTAAFIIGALALLVAIIGKFKTIIEPTPLMRLVLAVFGLMFIFLSLGAYTANVRSVSNVVPTPHSPPESQLDKTDQEATPRVVDVTAPESETLPATVTPEAPTQLTVCEIIARDLPQSAQGIADKFSIPVRGITDFLHENCGADVIDGFVVQGGVPVTLQVYPGGCIDAPQDATFSAATTSNGVGGLRAYDGTVRTAYLTYRMSCR